MSSPLFIEMSTPLVQCDWVWLFPRRKLSNVRPPGTSSCEGGGPSHAAYFFVILNCMFIRVLFWLKNTVPSYSSIQQPSWGNHEKYSLFNCESKQFNNLSDQLVCVCVCLFVCLCVCLHFWNSSLKGSPSQSEHSLRLTNQSEDSIISALSADISCSIKTDNII